MSVCVWCGNSFFNCLRVVVLALKSECDLAHPCPSYADDSIRDSKFLLLPATEFNRGRSTFYLVFEFCEHDLAGLLTNMNVKFSLGEIKSVMKQLLEGLYYIHNSRILHRWLFVRWTFLVWFCLGLEENYKHGV